MKFRIGLHEQPSSLQNFLIGPNELQIFHDRSDGVPAVIPNRLLDDARMKESTMIRSSEVGSEESQLQFFVADDLF